MFELETERLRIRNWRESDVTDAYCVLGDATVRRYTGEAFTPEQMEAFVAKRIAKAEQFCVIPLIEKASDNVVGVAGLQPLLGGPEVEIGWMLAVTAWGKGYATEIARSILAHGLDVLKLERIVATIDQSNSASVAVARRIGMQYDRIIRYHERDMLLYERRQRTEGSTSCERS